MPIYGLDIGKNLIQVYTTTEVLTILQEAIDNQSLAGLDPSIAPVITAVKESNGNNNITFWLGTEAEFNALGITAKQIFARVDATGKLYLCTDDSTLDDWLAAAKAEITGDVAADITEAQTTADEALIAANGANSFYSRGSFVTEVMLETSPGVVETATDYSLSSGSRFQKVTAKSPNTGYCNFGLMFSFNDARVIPAGTWVRFYCVNNADDKVEFFGQGIVLGYNNLGKMEYVGIWTWNRYLNYIEVYLEKSTASIDIHAVTTGSYTNNV